MECTADDLALIVSRNATLSDRLGPAWRATPGRRDERVIASRLVAWQRALQCDETSFDARLAGEGLGSEAVAAALGAGQFMPDALPPWVDTLKHCLAGGQARTNHLLDPNDALPFEELWLPFVGAAIDRLDAAIGDSSRYLLPGARHDAERQLLVRLARLAEQTVFTEFALTGGGSAGRFEHLAGQPFHAGRERYDRFVGELRGGGLMRFLREYSVLARLLATEVDQWVANTARLLGHVFDDWNLLAQLGDGRGIGLVRTGLVARIRPDLSDRHNGGQTVVELTFESGARLLYKPRDVAVEDCFAAFVAWCAAHGLPDAPRMPRTISRPGYGWVEYIEHRGCVDRTALQRYGRRAGTLLCMLYMLDASDCHRDNLVACGEFPVPVDLEVVLTPRLRHGHVGTIEHKAWLLGTVMRTGLLPVWTAGVVPDSAGFGTLAGIDAPLDTWCWEDVNTDTMKRVCRSAVDDTPRTNMPLLASQPQGAQEYAPEMRAGFEATYRWLLDHRDELLARTGPLALFAQCEVRAVLRNTAVFDTVLVHLHQPHFQREGVDRAIMLQSLERGFSDEAARRRMKAVIAIEQADLDRFDVPRHLCRADGTGILVGSHTDVPDLLVASPYDLLCRRWQSFDVDDLRRQLAVIDAALQSPEATQDGGTRGAPDPLPHAATDGFLLAARAIGEELALRALPAAGGGLTWIDLAWEPLRGGFEPMLLGHSLYAGSAGVALFFAQLSCCTGDQAWAALARDTLGGILGTVDDRAVAASVGAGAGLGGQIYALVRCGQLLGDSELITAATAFATHVTPDLLGSDERCDVLDGVAGCILGLLALNAHPRDSEVLGRALMCGEQLIDRRVVVGDGIAAWLSPGNKCLTGFSHGAAGIAYALLRLFEVSGDERFLRTAEEAMAFERSVFDGQQGNWPDFRGSTVDFVSTWCHGATGIGLARLGGLAIHVSPTICEEIAIALRQTLQGEALVEDHLCCGVFGRIETLLVAGYNLGRPELIVEARRQAAYLLAQRSGHGWRLDADLPFHNPVHGLFHGLAGIGYGLLRLFAPEQVPSVLLWQPGVGARGGVT